jgi:DNA repair protein RecO (recombination protein O)
MAIVKSEAILLHHRDQGETSKIVTLFTLLFGKASLIAKGSRNLKSPYGAALEPFTHVEVVFYKKENRDLHFLSQADILNPFTRIHGQLGRIALASIPCEIVQRHEIAGHAHPALFRLLLETLHGLNEAETGLRNLVRAFQLKFAELSGFRPQLDHCCVCGSKSRESEVLFEHETGGYRCSACRTLAAAGSVLPGYGLEVLRYLQCAGLRLAGQARVSPELGAALDECLQKYIGYHMENLHYLSSIKHLQQLQDAMNLK